MDKASDVYLTVVDQTTVATGPQGLIGVLPMYTTRGETKTLNRVDITNYKEILGYDLAYNSNYLGLTKVLDLVNYVYVYRMNKDPIYANRFFKDGTLQTLDDCTDLAQLVAQEADYTIALGYAGFDQQLAVGFTPNLTSQVIANVAGTYTLSSIPSDKDGDVTKLQIFNRDGTLAYTKRTVVDTGTNTIKLFATENPPEPNPDDPDTPVPDEPIATLTIGTAELVVNQQIATGDYLMVKWVDSAYQDWSLDYYDNEGTDVDPVYKFTKSVDFSLDTTSDIYWKNVKFPDLVLDLTGVTSEITRDPIDLLSGSNGTEATVEDIQSMLLKKCPANVFFTNGSFPNSIVNKFIEVLSSAKKTSLIDVPDYTTSDEAIAWATGITRSEYAQLYWITDNVETAIGEVPIYPSVNAFIIYINMYANYQCGNYPPAGYTTGTISATKLTETDYEYFRDELKTARVNYQIVDSNGPVMWEQRTLFSKNTDLSYAAPVFIVRDLTAELVSLLKMYGFTYLSPTDLVTLGSSLEGILDDYVTDNFIYNYELNIPSFEEVMASNRELNIEIGVYVTKDSEVINLKLVLKD